MYWTNYFYWLIRWTCAVPVALFMSLAFLGIILFDSAFGCAKDWKAATEWSELTGILKYLFVMKLER